ncbi:unnamed protein product [Kuraishia capsulata CBS 1993]|uniref:Golgi to ER traffic protein 2 n=1 Tax=Kuraishia capsulata CBS 1993 TaxID=1382522 RepID=W6MLD9_9ASCO|nr:uncharacterized protein KUCA_T00001582001 [Kuraishia capsulata CBS 1993]CDK25612.1 unnamed protein product [Kuraishia capsulata CBS 1993]
MSDLSEAEKRNLLRQRRLAKAKMGADRLNKITGMNQSYKEPEAVVESTTKSTGQATLQSAKQAHDFSHISEVESVSHLTAADPDMMDISAFQPTFHDHMFGKSDEPMESPELVEYRAKQAEYVRYHTQFVTSVFLLLRYFAYAILFCIPDLTLKNWLLILHVSFQIIYALVVSNLENFQPSSMLSGIISTLQQFLPPVWVGRLKTVFKLQEVVDLSLADFSFVVCVYGLKSIFSL